MLLGGRGGAKELLPLPIRTHWAAVQSCQRGGWLPVDLGVGDPSPALELKCRDLISSKKV